MATQTASTTIDQLIITSPYNEPSEHWKYDRETRRFTREPGRRPAGYIRASDASKSFDDPGEFVELPLVNKIRPRVDAWIIPEQAASHGDFSNIGETSNSERAAVVSFSASLKRLRR